MKQYLLIDIGGTFIKYTLQSVMKMQAVRTEVC